jgi:DNA-binding NtrC family response regulator
MDKTLLVVDDEPDIQDALFRHFRFLGYNVFRAHSGREALDVLAGNRISVLISDIRLKEEEMSGVELLKTVKREYPMVHVVMITGYVTQDNVLSCMRHGADTCVFKPWPDLTELERAVNDAVTSIRTWKQKLHQLHDMKPKERSPDE